MRLTRSSSVACASATSRRSEPGACRMSASVSSSRSGVPPGPSPAARRACSRAQTLPTHPSGTDAALHRAQARVARGQRPRDRGGAVVRPVVDEDHAPVAGVVLREQRRQGLRKRRRLVARGHQHGDRRPGGGLGRRAALLVGGAQVPGAGGVQQHARARPPRRVRRRPRGRSVRSVLRPAGLHVQPHVVDRRRPRRAPRRIATSRTKAAPQVVRQPAPGDAAGRPSRGTRSPASRSWSVRRRLLQPRAGARRIPRPPAARRSPPAPGRSSRGGIPARCLGEGGLAGHEVRDGQRAGDVAGAAALGHEAPAPVAARRTAWRRAVPDPGSSGRWPWRRSGRPARPPPAPGGRIDAGRPGHRGRPAAGPPPRSSLRTRPPRSRDLRAPARPAAG